MIKTITDAKRDGDLPAWFLSDTSSSLVFVEDVFDDTNYPSKGVAFHSDGSHRTTRDPTVPPTDPLGKNPDYFGWIMQKELTQGSAHLDFMRAWLKKNELTPGVVDCIVGPTVCKDPSRTFNDFPVSSESHSNSFTIFMRAKETDGKDVVLDWDSRKGLDIAKKRAKTQTDTSFPYANSMPWNHTGSVEGYYAPSTNLFVICNNDLFVAIDAGKSGILKTGRLSELNKRIYNEDYTSVFRHTYSEMSDGIFQSLMNRWSISNGTVMPHFRCLSSGGGGDDNLLKPGMKYRWDYEMKTSIFANELRIVAHEIDNTCNWDMYLKVTSTYARVAQNEILPPEPVDSLGDAMEYAPISDTPKYAINEITQASHQPGNDDMLCFHCARADRETSLSWGVKQDDGQMLWFPKSKCNFDIKKQLMFLPFWLYKQKQRDDNMTIQARLP